MSVPNIKPPPGTPRFQQGGHSIDEDSAYAQVEYGTGGSRARRLTTETQRIISVGWWLTAARLAAVENWYEVSLRAGEREFAAEVKTEGEGTQWWTARWVQFQTEMKTKNRGRVTGKLLLTGTPQTHAPNGVDLAMTAGSALLDIRSNLALATDMTMSISIDLLSSYT